MSVAKSPRSLKKKKEDHKADMVAVHRAAKREISSDRETFRTEASEESSGSNRTYIKEDNNRNENNSHSHHNTPSRDISVDGESQINSKIITLIESEIKRETKHTTFSDSRPQSLSFYEEEKMPEELSGNLELLSPEERRHYKSRKHYSHMDTDERNMYNSIQDIYNRENEDMVSSSLKKSKSRKKKHGGDTEMGMGDSREMMIPKEKRKSKKKKHESPMSGKRKHRKREDDFDIRNNEITLALEELQDDVFENNVDDVRHEKVKKSPRKSDKVYVQRKNKFEVTTRENNITSLESHPIRQQFKANVSPLHSALNAQKYWRKFTNFCHGLLGGLGFAHMVYISTNQFTTDAASLKNYALYSDIYVTLFYILCVLCLVSVFDKYDIANISVENFRDFFKNRKSSFVILLYMITLVLHLATAPKDDQIALIAHDFNNSLNVSAGDMKIWTSMSFSRGFFAFIAWFFVSLTSNEDFLYTNLKTMDTFVVPVG